MLMLHAQETALHLSFAKNFSHCILQNLVPGVKMLISCMQFIIWQKQHTTFVCHTTNGNATPGFWRHYWDCTKHTTGNTSKRRASKWRLRFFHRFENQGLLESFVSNSAITHEKFCLPPCLIIVHMSNQGVHLRRRCHSRLSVAHAHNHRKYL